jgi:hypothetical protein
VEHQFFFETKFYLDKKTGYWITTGCPKKRMHVVVWEYFNGKVPKKYHIHHKDGNKSNNEISNLELISHHDHMVLHMTVDRRERARKMAGQFRYLTKAWHASEEGSKWHKEHGILAWAKRKPIIRLCSLCKKKFTTKTFHQMFCSNKCKSAYRRKEGIDDVTIRCKICDKEFKKNKYSDIETCSKSCGGKFRSLISKKRISDEPHLVCKLCGKQFKSRRNGGRKNVAKCCSGSCGAKLRWGQKREESPK